VALTALSKRLGSTVLTELTLMTVHMTIPPFGSFWEVLKDAM